MSEKHPQRRASEHITPELIEQYRTWTNEAAAQIYDKRLRAIERGYTQTFTELQLILVECDARELWRYALNANGKHPSGIRAWIVDCLPVSNGTAFSALKCGRELVDMPVEEREEIPRGNQETLAIMSPSLRKNPKIKAAAKRLTPDKFLEMVERDHPDQHIEAKRRILLRTDRSQRTNIDKAIEICMVVDEATSREDALDKICETYIGLRQHIYDEMKGEGSREIVQ